MNDETVDRVTLIRRASKGDDAAFAELMSIEKRRLYRIAFAHLQNELDALEAIQETTYRAYKSIRKLREPKFFGTWVTRILLNYCMDELKRRKRMLVNTEHTARTLDGYASAATVASSGRMIGMAASNSQVDSQGFAMRLMLDQLQPQSKQLIILKYLEDLTIAQIAELLGSPDSTIKTRLGKALAELRKLWMEDGESYA